MHDAPGHGSARARAVMARHLVVGGDGLIGRAIFELLSTESAQVERTTRRAAAHGALALDLAAPGSAVASVPGLARLLDGGPLVVYLAAAIAGYAQCEANPAATRQVNVLNAVRLADELVSRGAFVVFLSSTAVFSGARSINAEADATDPVSEYGRQKAEAETRLRALTAAVATGGGVAIVRLTKVVAPGAGIIAAWINDLGAGRAIEAARDLRFAPVSLDYAARNLVRLGALRRSGTFHLSGAGDMAYSEFAGLLAAALGAAPGLVASVAVREKPGSTILPQIGVLDMRETSARTGIRPQEIADVVSDLLRRAGRPG